MTPHAKEVEARLAAAGELFTLSESVQSATGALLKWEQVISRGLQLRATAQAPSVALEPGDLAFEAAPSAATQQVGAVFTMGVERPGAVVPARATLVAVLVAGRRVDALPANMAGIVVVRALGETGAPRAGLTLIDGRRLALVAPERRPTARP